MDMMLHMLAHPKKEKKEFIYMSQRLLKSGTIPMTTMHNVTKTPYSPLRSIEIPGRKDED